MNRRERISAILKITAEQKKISIRELSEYFNLSSITIRKDILYIENQGLVKRSHGNVLAISTDPLSEDTSFNARQSQNTKIKKTIAYAALSLIKNKMTIFVDNSSTVTHIIPLLKKYSELTVITNSLASIRALEYAHNIQIGILGGLLNRTSQHIVGSTLEEQIKSYKIDIAFFGAYGFNGEYFSDVDAVTSEYKKIVSKYAEKKFVFADHTKFCRSEGSPTLTLNEITNIYTDEFPSLGSLDPNIYLPKIKISPLSN